LEKIARVVVDLALDREFDYRVPEHLAAELRIGSQVLVPFGHSEARGYIVGFADRSTFEKLKDIKEPIGKKPLIEESVLGLARWMADYYMAPVERAVRTVLPGAVRRKGAAPKQRLSIMLTDRAGDAAVVDALRRRAPRQAAVLDYLKEHGPTPLQALLREAGTSAQTVRALQQHGLAVASAQSVARDPFAELHILPSERLPLMPQQAESLAIITRSVDTLQPPVVLLFGVTGSGKTEVYLQAIDHVRQRGRGAIVLVPEIALTPQTVDRFRSRFQEEIAVLHSELSDGERHDEWHRVHDGKARIVVGARSALFAPVRDLGLIVVDEEHEPTYKQDEAPRYNARDVAVMRGHREGCAVVLGTATPSLESYYNAHRGKYGLAVMPHRVDHRQMPAMRVVDMRQEAAREGKIHVLSADLRNAIEDRLQRAEQTILFLNRRGFATSMVCPKCGHVARCDQCSVAMTYHKKRHTLLCHICGHEQAVPAVCPNPECRDPAFRYAGIGTQRVEEVVAKVFPKARVVRMDSDTMTRKDSYRRVLGDFRTGKIDILLGTQMIAKGLDFPNVTLVGVIYADLSLHMPDFRAGERTFQLLTQVAGRAGRGDIVGEVIVQTYTPFHPAVQAARRLDYASFFDQEAEFRRELSYPPFFHLVCLTLRGVNEEKVKLTLDTLARELKPRLGQTVVVSDAAPAPIARVKGQYRYQLLLRAPNPRLITGPLRELLKEFKMPKDVGFAVDVDALSLL
jgi:primosomal protein N' (replication factor Y)